ncbi:RagB/SusD family nutrient uptake outer membrane protein [Arachidicoccus ginsenosidimutans]
MAFVLVSCKKFLNVGAPKTQLSSEGVFNNDSTAMAAIRGIYALMGTSGYASGQNSSITYCATLSGDDVTSFSTSVNDKAFYTNTLTSEIGTGSLWTGPYQTIYQANDAINRLARSKSISSATRKEATGEAKFLRAFAYFYLVNMFGDVPLILGTDYNQNTNATRTDTADVYKQIISDLEDAEGSLASDYSVSAGSRTRVNKFAATALLARVYLYNRNWVNAEQQASLVIDNKQLYDTVSLNDVFLLNSKAAIWQLLPGSQTSANEASLFVLAASPSTNSYGSTTISPGLLAAFDAADRRKTSWIGTYTTTVAPIDIYYFPNKYKIPSATVLSECNTVLRLAEQYLIRAEARIWQGRIDDGVHDLNVVRERAGAPLLPDGLSQADALLAVEKERRLEFFAEWGQRWFDLKRTGRAKDIMPADDIRKGGTWQDDWQLYPIPENQLLNDPNMANEQNPGYTF